MLLLLSRLLLVTLLLLNKSILICAHYFYYIIVSFSRAFMIFCSIFWLFSFDAICFSKLAPLKIEQI